MTSKAIAEDFLARMNPEHWDGKGDMPCNVRQAIYEHQLDDHYSIELVIIDEDFDEEIEFRVAIDLTHDSFTTEYTFCDDCGDINAIADCIDWAMDKWKERIE